MSHIPSAWHVRGWRDSHKSSFPFLALFSQGLYSVITRTLVNSPQNGEQTIPPSGDSENGKPSVGSAVSAPSISPAEGHITPFVTACNQVIILKYGTLHVTHQATQVPRFHWSPQDCSYMIYGLRGRCCLSPDDRVVPAGKGPSVQLSAKTLHISIFNFGGLFSKLCLKLKSNLKYTFSYLVTEV